MRTFFYLIASLFIMLHCRGQQSVIDSMLSAGKKLHNEDKVNNLINLSREYFVMGDTNSRKFSREAISLAKKIGFKEGRGKAYLFLGLSFNQNQLDNAENDSALKFYKLSSKILSEINHPWAGFGYENGGSLMRNRGWYPEAIEFQFKALSIYQTAKDSLQCCKTISSIGYSYDRIGNHKEAIVWQKKAINLYSKSANASVIGLVYGRLGISYDELKMYDSAHFYNAKALTYFKEAKDSSYISQWLSNIGNTYIKEGNYTQAEKLIKQSLKFDVKDFDKAIRFSNLGKIYIETQRYKAAESILDSAIVLALRFQRLETLSETYLRKYELYKALNNPHQALEFFIKHSSINDSLQNDEKIKQIAYMKVKYETEQKENELLIEKAENEKLAKEKALIKVSVSNRDKWIIGISGFSLILILFVLFISQRIKRKIQAERDAALLNEKQAGLNAVITAQEDERKRIAKDLHDGIVQQIGSVIIGWRTLISNKSDENASEKLLLNTLEASSDELRELSHRMMPRALGELGVIAAIDDLLHKSLIHTGITYSFEHFGISERLKENTEICLYRVIQELVNNLLKHSKASHVSVQLYNTEQHLLMIVEDNGIGFTSTNTQKGIGILNVTTRVNALEGTVSFEPGIENGTLITLKIPTNKDV
jgi:signal transduction histidine kinase